MTLFSKNKTRLKRSQSIVFAKEGNDNLKEAYIRLKDNILYYGIDGKNKVIQIESSISGEAKTTTTCNLAVCLGLSGKKICVVDLDFRKARVHRSFNLDIESGISDYLTGKIDKKSLIKQTSYENVSIITRGSEVTNASLLLTSQKIINLFEELKKEYDYILIDCPPVLIISDYIHISHLSDGVLFIVAYGKTKKKYVSDAVSLLRKNNIPIIGSAFTFFDPKKSNSRSEYGYYKHYGYQDK